MNPYRMKPVAVDSLKKRRAVPHQPDDQFSLGLNARIDTRVLHVGRLALGFEQKIDLRMRLRPFVDFAGPRTQLVTTRRGIGKGRRTLRCGTSENNKENGGNSVGKHALDMPQKGGAATFHRHSCSPRPLGCGGFQPHSGWEGGLCPLVSLRRFLAPRAPLGKVMLEISNLQLSTAPDRAAPERASAKLSQGSGISPKERVANRVVLHGTPVFIRQRTRISEYKHNKTRS